MPSANPPKIKEFLYVDVDRTRSLLAQMTGGVIDEIRSAVENDAETAAKAAFFGFGAEGGYRRSWHREESRSMQEYVFVGFESVAEETGLIGRAPAVLHDPARWADGSVHQDLMLGELLRVTCEVQILDSSFFAGRVDRLLKLAEGFVDMSWKSGSVPGKGRGQGKGAAESAREKEIEALLEMPAVNYQGIRAIVESLVGEETSVRLLPCGLSHLEYCLVGSLLGRKEYMQEERESLFSRYGQTPEKWTVVFQVSAIPAPTASATLQTETAPIEGQRINRGALEQIVNGVMGTMDSIGIAGGPSWPSISITPLGIYRLIPTRNQ